MKMRNVIVGLLIAGASIGLNAQKATPTVTKKQINQKVRIAQGAKSGELTRVETLRLNRQQRKINNLKQVAKADGVVTLREKRVINAHQRHASRCIRNQKHDLQKR